MRNKMAVTKSVAALQVAYEQLEGRGHGIPGMGLVHGYTGAGKTTAVTWLVNRTRGVYVRALRTWTPNTMLAKVLAELQIQPRGRNAEMVDQITTALLESQRPLFVDEADYLLKDADMIETLRDVHDVAGVPVVMVGMEGIEKRLRARPQLAGRISHWVEFLRSDIDDARAVTDTVCEVQVADDLLELLHGQAGGSVRNIVVGLARIEQFAKANGLTSIGADQWGGRKLFIGGAQ